MPDRALHVAYTPKYAHVAQAIHLYALALQQADPYSEYLCYCRVIENMTKSNGVVWLTGNPSRLPSASFGRLWYTDGLGGARANLLTLLKKRATKRLRKLQMSRTDEEIAVLLYGTDRCGIAHGSSIRRMDYATDFRDVAENRFIVKMMARLAVDDCVT